MKANIAAFSCFFLAIVVMPCALTASDLLKSDAPNHTPNEPSMSDLEQSAGDRDSDGVNGFYDNCPYTFNPDQKDSLGDGIGDVCREPVAWDVSGDRIVDCMDILLVKGMIGQRKENENWNPSADINKDGVIDTQDLALVSQHLPSNAACTPLNNSSGTYARSAPGQKLTIYPTDSRK